MNLVWNEGELNNPTEVGLDQDSQQETVVIAEREFPAKNLTVSLHRHLDGKLLRVMKTIANAGRLEIHVDVPMGE